ncbi:hypothetical protein C8J56DRAFT_888949 [Mycena floridula]|nr:hypothetical protein C8J56DRAFT_888949 [Mycena floridula]
MLFTTITVAFLCASFISAIPVQSSGYDPSRGFYGDGTINPQQLVLPPAARPAQAASVADQRKNKSRIPPNLAVPAQHFHAPIAAGDSPIDPVFTATYALIILLLDLRERRENSSSRHLERRPRPIVGHLLYVEGQNRNLYHSKVSYYLYLATNPAVFIMVVLSKSKSKKETCKTCLISVASFQLEMPIRLRKFVRSSILFSTFKTFTSHHQTRKGSFVELDIDVDISRFRWEEATYTRNLSASFGIVTLRRRKHNIPTRKASRHDKVRFCETLASISPSEPVKTSPTDLSLGNRDHETLAVRYAEMTTMRVKEMMMMLLERKPRMVPSLGYVGWRHQALQDVSYMKQDSASSTSHCHFARKLNANDLASYIAR